MQIEFLGTGAGVPSQNRNVTSIALKMLDERNEIWLFDCGEATQHTILKTAIRPRKITKIFITHLHGDHIFGLPGLLSSRAFQGGEDALTIYGPKGIRTFVQTSLQVSHSHLKYPIHFVELDHEGLVFEDESIKVTYTSLKHGVECYAYRVEEKDLVGQLQVDKLKALNIPSGPLYGKIKRGEDVTLEDGTILHGKDFIGPSKKGRHVVIFGDTRYNVKHADFAKKADVIIHEATYGKGEDKLAFQHFHSTCMQAAALAQAAQARQLYLTHISSRYMGSAVKKLETDAQQVFPNTQLAHDLLLVEVPFHD